MHQIEFPLGLRRRPRWGSAHRRPRWWEGGWLPLPQNPTPAVDKSDLVVVVQFWKFLLKTLPTTLCTRPRSRGLQILLLAWGSLRLA